MADWGKTIVSAIESSNTQVGVTHVTRDLRIGSKITSHSRKGKKHMATAGAGMSPRLRALQSAPLNSWIALSEDESRIVAVGSTYQEAVAKSEDAGVSDPIILRTPPSWAPLFVSAR
jgi:hypothetical protein